MKSASANYKGRPSNLAHFAVAILLSVLICACSDNPSVELNIETGDASVMLKEFARQANVEIVYNTASVEGIRTKAVRGSLNPREALDRMLEGTPLEARKERDSGAFAVYRKPDSRSSRSPVEPDALHKNQFQMTDFSRKFNLISKEF